MRVFQIRCSIVFNYIVLLRVVFVYCGKFERLKNSLHSSIFNTWELKLNFSSFVALKLDRQSIQLGIQDGERTNEAFERIVKKVLKGESIIMYVFGGSSTKGADLGCNNRQSTFHYALLTWWNKIIGPATGSYLKRKVIAVGGVGSTYFGHCWEEYIVTKNETIDIFLWEFYINDPDSNYYGNGVEKFVRSVLSYGTHPALIFTKFFPLANFPNVYGEYTTCSTQEYKNMVLTTLSKYYSFADINLLPTICHYMSTVPYHGLTASNMFINKHPSHLAHAQLGYLLISYIRQKFSILLTKLNSQKHVSYQQKTDVWSSANFQLPVAIYNASNERSTCWNAVLPDDRFMLDHSLYQLTVNYRYGFTTFRTPKWETGCAVRRDVRGGYITEYPKKRLSLTFQVPGNDRKNIYAAVSHVEAGGLSTFSVKDNHLGREHYTTIDCSRRNYKAMDVNYLGTYDPGTKELIVETLTGGCELSAIIVE